MKKVIITLILILTFSSFVYANEQVSINVSANTETVVEIKGISPISYENVFEFEGEYNIPLTFYEVGDYTYEIRQAGTDENIFYDESIYVVDVKVFLNNGALDSAVSAYIKGEKEKQQYISFENTVKKIPPEEPKDPEKPPKADEPEAPEEPRKDEPKEPSTPEEPPVEEEPDVPSKPETPEEQNDPVEPEVPEEDTKEEVPKESEKENPPVNKEVPKETPKKAVNYKTVFTGDETNILPVIGLLSLSVIGIAIAIFIKKRK